MASLKNIEQIGKIKEMLAFSKSVVMVNYQGLTHQQLETLRSELEKTGGKFTVVKNTLLLRALKNLKVKGIEEDKFVGPIGLVLSNMDEVTALQVFSNFIKNQGAGEVKFGVMEGEFYPKAKVVQLSNLPGIEILRAQVVGTIASPLSGLIRVLSGNTRKLVVVLSEIKNLPAGRQGKKELN